MINKLTITSTPCQCCHFTVFVDYLMSCYIILNFSLKQHYQAIKTLIRSKTAWDRNKYNLNPRWKPINIRSLLNKWNLQHTLWKRPGYQGFIPRWINEETAPTWQDNALVLVDFLHIKYWSCHRMQLKDGEVRICVRYSEFLL